MADSERWSSSLSSETPRYTLPEHHSSLSLLLHFDHAWFQDNLLKLRVGLLNAFLPLPNPPLPPYQSIELVDFASHNLRCSASACPSEPLPSISGRGAMPRARFQALLPLQQSNGCPDLPNADSDDLQPECESLPLTSASPPASPTPATPRRNVFSTLHADNSICTPASVHSWSMKSLLGVEDIPVNPIPPDLDFVLSGKLSRISLRELQVFQPALKVLKPKRNHRSKNSKSTAPAGHDEILGSTDTDFQYSQENLAPRLVTMLPSRKYQLRGDMNAVRRPLGAHNKPRQNSLLLEASPDSLHHWQIRATNEDIKEHLKFWARAVALAIRQEC